MPTLALAPPRRQPAEAARLAETEQAIVVIIDCQ